MKDSWPSVPKLLLDAITVAAGLYLLAVGSRALLPRESPPATNDSSSSFVGRSLTTQFPDESWTQGRLTLVLFIREACPYCQKSIPFHKQIVDQANKSGIRVIAVSDDSPSLLRTTLVAQRLNVAAAYSKPLASLGILGTPSIALVDRAGTVQGFWRGYVAEGERSTLVRAVSDSSENTPPIRQVYAGKVSLDVAYAPADEAVQFVMGDANRFLIDIRDREQFRKGHLESAINIPADELDTRARLELPVGADIGVFCDYQAKCEEKAKNNSSLTSCTFSVMAMRARGLNARLLQVDLASARRHGLVVGRTRQNAH